MKVQLILLVAVLGLFQCTLASDKKVHKIRQATREDIAQRHNKRTHYNNPPPVYNPGNGGNNGGNPSNPGSSPVPPTTPGYCSRNGLSASNCCGGVVCRKRNSTPICRRNAPKTSYNPVNDNCCAGNLVGTPVGCCPAAYSANKGHARERGYCCASAHACCASFTNDGTCLSPFDPGNVVKKRDIRSSALTPRDFVNKPQTGRTLLNSTQGIEYVLGQGKFTLDGNLIDDSMHSSFVSRAVTRAVHWGQTALAHLGVNEIEPRAKWILDPEWNPKQQFALSDGYKVDIADGRAIIDGILADPNFKSFQHYWFEVDRDSLEQIKALLP